MKRLFSILLILTTSLYVLPVKEVIHLGDPVCMMDMDEAKEETSKKEKNKELFSLSANYLCQQDSYSCLHQMVPVSLPVQLHLVETPPPDQV
ncbi:MAG: hypothetical protein IPI66_13885 [Chitinophagaceae bacterium]|nr:hypothetical protein [Chitinophagaceae bacterium]MBL0055211.1 hypothetical protein [Chitinophagaceae bacterium]